MIEKKTGNGQTNCFGCQEKGKYALNWDSFLYTYNGRPYCYDCLKEMLKEFANDLGYNIIKKRVVPKMLPCICGCKRREHWSRYVRDTGEHLEILVCEKCGKQVEGKDKIDVINNWNKTIMESKLYHGGFASTDFINE